MNQSHTYEQRVIARHLRTATGVEPRDEPEIRDMIKLFALVVFVGLVSISAAILIAWFIK